MAGLGRFGTRMTRYKPLLWLSALTLLSALVLAYPVYVIRPFRYQDPRELSLALGLLRFRPLIELALIALALFCLVIVWRRGLGRWSKAGASICTLIVIAFGALSRVNIYEKMFHPLDQPTFSPQAKSKLTADEQVIAVRVRGEARAYPVRSISYHHIVNDVVGGLPIVATY